MGKVIAICTSPAKGTQKTRIEEGTFIEDFGLEGDAHAGKWHRQISLLSYDKIDAIVCQNDDGALGVVEALKSAGKLDSIQVLGIDGSDDALQSIQDGEMTMTALQDAKAQAEAGADIFEKIMKISDCRKGLHRGRIVRPIPFTL